MEKLNIGFIHQNGMPSHLADDLHISIKPKASNIVIISLHGHKILIFAHFRKKNYLQNKMFLDGINSHSMFLFIFIKASPIRSKLYDLNL